MSVFRALVGGTVIVIVTLSIGIEQTHAQLCDFDGDGFCNTGDIDALSEQVILGDPNFDPKFDLTVDGQLDLADRDEWLSLAAIENGFGSPYFLGDANLDGRVTSADLMQLGANWQLTDHFRVRWSGADFTMDGTVNAHDLNALAINWQKQNPSAAALPEPASFLLLMFGVASVHRLVRLSRRGLVLVAIVLSLVLGSFTGITLAQLDCDLNDDGLCDVVDMDDLTRAIATNSDDPVYDLNADGVVNAEDLDPWLESGAEENGFAEPYLTGDADLDGDVDAADLNALALSWQQSGKAWSQGDFFVDGTVNASDLMSLAINWRREIVRAAAAVPEPMSCVPLILGGWLLFHAARRVSLGLIVIPLILCGLAEVAFAQPPCDLDGDGICDILDIDDLSREIASGVLSDPKYDLNDDGVLDQQDLDEWLARGGDENGFAEPYLRGDANLDGIVNATDLNALGLHWQQSDKVWSQGDFSADGSVDAQDLMLVGLNWQRRIPLAAAEVPEPMSVLSLFVGAFVINGFTRRHRRQAIAAMGAVWLTTSQSAVDIWSQIL